MTKVINSNNKNFEEDFNDLLIMNRSSDTNVTETVSSIIADIRNDGDDALLKYCLLYTSPSPRDGLLSRMPSSA